MSDDGTVSDPGIPATIGDAELAMSEFGVVTEARTLRIRRVLPGRSSASGRTSRNRKSEDAGWRPGPWSCASAAAWS